MPVSRAFFYTSLGAPEKKSLLIKQNPSKSPVELRPHRGPLKGPLRTGMLLSQSQCFIHSLVSVRVPRIGALPRNGATTYGHIPRSPTRTEGLHKMRCGLVPQRDRLQLRSLPQCYAAFSAIPSNLARLNQSPDSQGVS
jgi:hypothetical protein